VNYGTTSNAVVIQWARSFDNYEVRFEFEPRRWALPVEVEWSKYRNQARGYTHTSRHRSLRVLCGAIRFSHNCTYPDGDTR
jgi:hypothetical protein